MKRQLVIVNPCAGRRRALGRMGELLPILESDGVVSEVFQTAAALDARNAVAARAGEFSRVVCIGGDGTLNEVISGMLMAGADVPIGYLPAGSTNDLAASHGLPGELLAAARNVVEGEARPMDVGVFNGRYFVYTASFGAFTRASYAAPQRVKNAIGHLAYILEGARDAFHLRPYSLEIDVDGERIEGEFVFGMLSNSTSMGGVLKLDERRVDLHDGKFEVMLVRSPAHKAELLGAAWMLWQKRYEHPLVCMRSARRVQVHADAGMDWTLDGEFQPGCEQIQAENLHDAVRLILPRKTT